MPDSPTPVQLARWWIRRLWLTAAAIAVWPVAAVMISWYPEEKEYWKKILILDAVLIAAALAFKFL